MLSSRRMKIVVAYSGGLDTSVLLLWLKEKYNAEIIAYCADVGQGDELDGLEEKALEEFWRHRLMLISDDRRTLIGATERLDGDNAVVSETAAIAEMATSQIALDITLWSQRTKANVQPLMARMLGSRVGRLDSLLDDEGAPK